MPALPESRLVDLLQPYIAGFALPETLYAQLGAYLDLLLRWNARTNLTSVRAPEEMVQRHFGESLFAGIRLSELLATNASLLDFGSGAGFPGIPVQLLLPDLCCCLTESQGKKAAFLRECVRTLGLTAEVWANRVETMPSARKFDCVSLRAVDNMEAALLGARQRLAPGGVLAILGSSESVHPGLASLAPALKFPIPDSHSRVLYLYRSE